MSSFDEDLSVYSDHYEVEVLINRPISQVWKQYVDIPSWVITHRIETVSGEPGTVGSITRVAFKRAQEMGMPPPHYHYCKLIKLVPERRWVLKTYAEKGGSYGCQEFHTFDEGRVSAVDSQTTLVTFNLFSEIKAEAIARDPGGMNLDASRDGMQRNLENLKKVVEGR